MKKYMLLITTILFSSLLLITAVSAEELGYGELEARAIQDGYIDEYVNELPGNYFYSTGAQGENTIIDNIRNEIIDAWENYSSEPIDISELGFTTSDSDIEVLNDFYRGIVNNNPEYFYVKSSAGYEYSPSTGEILTLVPEYVFDDPSAIPELRENFNEKVNEALSVVDDSMSDIDKMIALHDYIVLKAEYDLDTFETHNNDHPTSFSAYGVLVNNIGVCQSYTLAYLHLLKEVGIEVSTVQSKTLNHIWNIVKIGNDWYHVDVTWDDPSLDRKGLVSYSYFLASDNEFGATGATHCANDWVTDFSATSEAYANAFWKTSASPLAYLDDYYYYTDGNGRNANIKRSKLTALEASEQVRALSNLTWKYNGGSVSGGQFRAVPFAFDRDLYYNTGDSIYRLCKSFSVDELVYKADLSDGFIVPVGVDESEHKVSYLNVTYDGSKYVYSSAYTASLDGGHSYSETVIPPTDTEYGHTEKSCPTCGDYQKYDITNPLKYKPGDPNGDGEITAIDAVVLARAVSGWSSAVDSALEFNLDLDGDDALSSIDVIILQRHLAGWVGYETIPFN